MKDLISLPFEDIGEGVDSKYRLCVLGAQRALQIIKGSVPQTDSTYRKATTTALSEITEGLVKFTQDDAAEAARLKDEDLYRETLATARSAYRDEDGNPLFHSPSESPAEPRQVGAKTTPAVKAAPTE